MFLVTFIVFPGHITQNMLPVFVDLALDLINFAALSAVQLCLSVSSWFGWERFLLFHAALAASIITINTGVINENLLTAMLNTSDLVENNNGNSSIAAASKVNATSVTHNREWSEDQVTKG